MGAIHFANAETFRHVVNSHLFPPINTTRIETAIIVAAGKDVGNAEESLVKCNAPDPLSSMPLTSDTNVSVPITKYFIFDCSALSYVDLSGTKELTSLYKDLMNKEIALTLANCCEPLIKQLERCNFFQNFPKSQIYPSIIDAVMTLSPRDQHSASVDHPEFP